MLACIRIYFNRVYCISLAYLKTIHVLFITSIRISKDSSSLGAEQIVNLWLAKMLKTMHVYYNLCVVILFQGVPGLKGSHGDPGMDGMQVTNLWHRNSIKYAYTEQDSSIVQTYIYMTDAIFVKSNFDE